MKIVGVLSGTSIDGIDVAVVDITDIKVPSSSSNSGSSSRSQDYTYSMNLKCYECIKWNPIIRERVRNSMNSNNLSARDFCEINVLIGQEFARAIQETLAIHNIDKSEIELIGSHGQTIWHQVGRDETVKGTLQLGESSEIANLLQISVVDQFRVMDVAMGGQGAPLTSIYDYLTVDRHSDKIVIVNNIGGMSNATLLPPRSEPDAESKLISFDTGPGNIMIDEAVSFLSHREKSMDIDGQWAASGTCHSKLLSEILSNPYFQEPIPKTTGREQFGTRQVHDWIEKARNMYQLSDADIVCTLTHVTVHSMIMAYRQAISDKYVVQPRIHTITVTGGGCHNKYLMKLLQERACEVFNDPDILVKSAAGDSKFADAKEAMLFALLAYLFHNRRNGNIRQVTGASHNSVLGKLTPYCPV